MRSARLFCVGFLPRMCEIPLFSFEGALNAGVRKLLETYFEAEDAPRRVATARRRAPLSPRSLLARDRATPALVSFGSFNSKESFSESPFFNFIPFFFPSSFFQTNYALPRPPKVFKGQTLEASS